MTENLSEMIARPYLRTPKAVIIQTSALVRRKRHEFVRAVEQGLIPPETPPMQRKRRKKYIDVSLVMLIIKKIAIVFIFCSLIYLKPALG